MRKLFKIQAPPAAVSIDLHGEYSFKKHKLAKEKIYYFDRLGKIRVNNEGEQWKENWDVIGEWKADTTGIVDLVVLGETFQAEVDDCGLNMKIVKPLLSKGT